MHKQSKKNKASERAFERRDKHSDEQMIQHHEERAFRRMAQSMGYRLPGADIRRKHEMEQ